MVGRSIGSGLKVKGSEVMQGQRQGLTRLRARQEALHSLPMASVKGQGLGKLWHWREERGEVGSKQLLTLLMDSVISIAKLVLGFWTFLGRVWGGRSPGKSPGGLHPGFKSVCHTRCKYRQC